MGTGPLSPTVMVFPLSSMGCPWLVVRVSQTPLLFEKLLSWSLHLVLSDMAGVCTMLSRSLDRMADEEKAFNLQPALDELVCALCIDTLKDPRSLKCLHSYCEKCLECLQKASAPGRVFCPECRVKTNLPPGGVKELPVNFKLKRLVEILTADERKEIIRRRSSPDVRPQVKPICRQHEDKPLEFYCEPCETLICGQCLIDEHRMHSGVKYASDVLGMYLLKLREVLPVLESSLESGESALLDIDKAESNLDASLSAGLSGVTTYFAGLHEILANKEKEVVAEMTSQAKKNGKGLRKLATGLKTALDAMRKTCLTIQDNVERRAEEVDLLLEENKLRVKVQAAMRLVEEEVQVCKKDEGALSSVASFIPSLTLEAKCKSIGYSQRKKRSLTTPEDNNMSTRAIRGRSDAFLRDSPKFLRPFVLGQQQQIDNTVSPFSLLAAKSGAYASINIVQPVSEVGTKALIGSCNAVAAYPFGVAISPDQGMLVVTDYKQHLYRMLTPTGKWLGSIGMEGKGEGQFTEPTGITVDVDGNILVLDCKNPGRAQKFSASGKYMTRYRARSLLNSAVSIAEPVGVAILTNRNILITDAAKACIHEFEASGKYCGKFGDTTDFKSPAGIAVSHNRVVVADQGNHSLYILTELGLLLKRVGQHGAGAGDLHAPFGVAFDRQGNIVVSECENQRISVFSAGGLFQRCFGCKGSHPGMFRTPRHLCFTPEGLLVVSDEHNQRLQLFDLTSEVSTI